MSEERPGPGWWLASDGRWYPPELEPPERPSSPSTPVPPTPATPPAPQPATWSAPETAQASRSAPQQVSPLPEPPRSARRVVVVALALVLLGGAAAGAGYILSDDDSTTNTTTTTATTGPEETTTTEPPGPPPFSDADTGVTLTLPEGWVGFDLTGRPLDQVTAEVVDLLADSPAEVPEAVAEVTAAAGRGDVMVAVLAAAPDAVGTTVIVSALPAGNDPNDPGVESSLRQQLELAGVEELAFQHVALPAGPALLATYRLVVTFDGNTIPLTSRKYVVGTGDSAWLLSFSSDNPERDTEAFDIIAETFAVG